MTKDDDGKIIYPSSGGYPYSEAIRAGDFVYVSGVIATNPDGSVSTGPIEVQTAMVLDRLKAILAKAGCHLADVIKCGCSLQDARDFAGFNKVYAGYFPSAPPTRTTLVVTHVLDARVEIDCVAYKPNPVGGAVDFVYGGLTREDLTYDKSQYPVEGTFTGVTPPWLNDLALVPSDWRPTPEDAAANAARGKHIEAELAYIAANVPRQRYTGATTEQLVEERYTLGMWSPEVFAEGQIDALTSNWIKSDAEFARQRLGGANPNVIKRADASGDDVSAWIGRACNGGELGPLGKRLSALQQQGKLFVCDYRALFGPVIDNGFVMNGRNFAAPVCFFSIDPDSDTLTPEAIQITGERAER